MSTPIEPATLALLTRAQGMTALTCLVLDDELLDRPTPCEGWTTSDVVVHLVGGAVLAAELLAGRSASEALAAREAWAARSTGGGDLRSIGSAFAEERSAFGACGLDDQVDHPALPMTAGSLLDQRLLEYAVHGWDIRRAVGGGPGPDDGVVDAALASIRPLASIIGQLGVFGAGPSGRLGPATAEEELVDLVGRRP